MVAFSLLVLIRNSPPASAKFRPDVVDAARGMGMSARQRCCADRAAARAAGDRRRPAHRRGDGHQRHRRRRVRQRRRPRHADLQRHRHRPRARRSGPARSPPARSRSPSTLRSPRSSGGCGAVAPADGRAMLAAAWQYLLAHPQQFATALGVHVALSAAALLLADGDRDSARRRRGAAARAARLPRSTSRTSDARCRRSPCSRW